MKGNSHDATIELKRNGNGEWGGYGAGSGLLHVNGGPGISLLLPDGSGQIDSNYQTSGYGQLEFLDLMHQHGQSDVADRMQALLDDPERAEAFAQEVSEVTDRTVGIVRSTATGAVIGFSIGGPVGAASGAGLAFANALINNYLDAWESVFTYQ